MPSHYHKQKGRHPPVRAAPKQKPRPPASYPNVERVLKVLNAGFIGHAAYQMLGLDSPEGRAAAVDALGHLRNHMITAR